MLDGLIYDLDYVLRGPGLIFSIIHVITKFEDEFLLRGKVCNNPFNFDLDCVLRDLGLIFTMIYVILKFEDEFHLREEVCNTPSVFN